MARTHLIVDTDPGMDDAVALLTAFGSPDQIDIRMITTVGGNVPLAMCTSNALRICELAGRRDVPVHDGCPKALLRPSNAVFHVHGNNGLGNTTLPEPTMVARLGHAVPAMIEAIRNASEPVTIAALAPMTNIAVALTMAPDIVANIREIVAMGGSFSGGNITPYASYNFHSDPHATHIVFNSGAPVVMVGLEITRQLKPDPIWLSALGQASAPAARFVSELWRDSPLCFNDASVVLHILAPGLFKDEAMHVESEINDPVRIGETRRIEGTPNVRVATAIDRTAAFARVNAALRNDRDLNLQADTPSRRA
jgi:purine nucleosidase